METLHTRHLLEGRQISPLYPNLLNQLIKVERNGVTEYNGGPLDLEGIEKSWLSPIEVSDKQGTQAFHIIYLNASPDSVRLDPAADLLLFDEMEMKLGREGVGVYEHFSNLLRNPSPHILVRPVQAGINHFPQVISPDQFDNDLLAQRIGHLTRELGINIVNSIDLRRRKKTLETQLGQGVTCISEQEYNSPFGTVNVIGMSVVSDPWKYYEIISGKNLVVLEIEREITLRIDSGCDSGQIYLDQECECRDQLHLALEQTLHEDGIIIHIPTQDGRGYGIVTKMETEGIKRGQSMVFNKSNPTPLDTIESAQMVFGPNFDIRTYGGIARILRALNFNLIALITENKVKYDSLKKAGITVSRRSAKAKEKPGCTRHVEAKSKHEDIYFDSNKTL